MDHVAVFVDAGYLFAQGTVALNGSKVKRQDAALDAPAAMEALKTFAAEKCKSSRLLRIYWYDGATTTRGTAEHEIIAYLDDVKLRLGFLNSNGEQKGVDSLIVTDMIELARLKSISDAVLVSGDEDVRVGVQIAQNYGVRVHLIGIKPSRGSQSHQLLAEADTTSEWDAAFVSKFLSIRAGTKPAAMPIKNASQAEAVIDAAPTLATLGEKISELDVIRTTVAKFIAEMGPPEIEGVRVFWETKKGVPSELDRKLLPKCREGLGRDLERSEITVMRESFKDHALQRLEGMAKPVSKSSPSIFQK